MDWVLVSKGYNKKTFYPAYCIGEALNAIPLTYKQAKNKSPVFWKDKLVVFHLVWVREHATLWDTFYRDVIANAAMVWFEFDADRSINELNVIDRGCLQTKFFLQKLFDINPHVIWELPNYYNPYVGRLNRIKLRIYDQSYEKPTNANKTNDFLGLIGGDKKNSLPLLHLLGRLKEAGYRTKCIVINNEIYNYYNNNWVELIKNGRYDSSSVQLFHNLVNESKILINLSRRITMGRTLYETLFNGALAVCSNTYGASELLFPDLKVDTLLYDLNDIYSLCINLVNRWTPELVEEYRKNARKTASIDGFIKDLKDRTNEYLNSNTGERAQPEST